MLGDIMWKVLIADDEPKIRQGLKNTLNAFSLPLHVCAEAKNGVDALEKAKEYRPDILLLDICMPRLSGIAFLEELQKLDLECKTIIISGFNEFSYAKQAMKLGVCAYLLKPIVEEELENTLAEVVKTLEETRKNRKFMEKMQEQFQQSRQYLREKFFHDWIQGKLTERAWKEQVEFLEMDIPSELFLTVVMVNFPYEKEMEMYRQTVEAIMEEELKTLGTSWIFVSRCQEGVGISGGYPQDIEEFQKKLAGKIEKETGGKCWVFTEICRRERIPAVYEEIHERGRKVMECKPVVQEARNYIYANYGKRDLDLTEVADAIGLNPSYLSRVMKQELGISFKDFLTMLRINHAIRLMRNQQLSLNQIAEQVGYSNQHYFSAAFKNCQGISPSEFRKTLAQE